MRFKSPRLEEVFERELCNAAIAGAGKSSERRAVADAAVGIAKVRVIEEVEELAVEFEFAQFANRELLEQREVHVDAARSEEHSS